MNNFSGDAQVFSLFSLIYVTGVLGTVQFNSLGKALKSAGDARQFAGVPVVKIIELIFADGRVTDAVLHDVRPSTWFGKSSPAQEPDHSARAQDGASK